MIVAKLILIALLISIAVIMINLIVIIATYNILNTLKIIKKEKYKIIYEKGEKMKYIICLMFGIILMGLISNALWQFIGWLIKLIY